MSQPLLGRSDLESFLQAAVSTAWRRGESLSLVILDVDHHRKLIDAHGPAAGERVVEALADLLAGRPDFAWRRSGPDEFLVVLPGVGEVRATRLAERIRRDTVALDLPWQPLTVSGGVAGTSGERTTPAQLEADARRALRRAKEQGRDRIEAAHALPSASERTPPPSSPQLKRRGPMGVVVLPPAQRRPIRKVLELSGLSVLEFEDLAAVRLPDHGADDPVLLVTSVPNADLLEAPLAAWGEVVHDAPASAVVFVVDAPKGGSLSVNVDDNATLLAGPPSAEGLLPLITGLLLDARRATGVDRIGPVAGGFGSRLATPNVPLTAGRILIVDDERASRAVLERTLRTVGFDDIRAVESGQEALAAVAERPPDLILLDLEMPRMDGFAVLEALEPLLKGDGFLPTLVVTGDPAPEHRQRVLRSGAKDFLHKPFDVSELAARVLNLLETRRLHLESEGARRALEESVGARTKQLGRAKDEIIFRLARAAEYRDDQTGRHAARVAAASAVLATVMGIPPERCDLLRRAAPLHDVGKIGIPDAILLKPGGLTAEEREVMRTHTIIGADLLARSTSDVIEEARVIALSHHERWDGRGYPKGLKGEAIPIQGRVVALADALDALTHERPYKPAYAFDESARRLIVEAGSAFDPEVVASLQSAAFRIRDILMEGEDDPRDSGDRAESQA